MGAVGSTDGAGEVVAGTRLPPVTEIPAPAITFPLPAMASVPLPCRLINAVVSMPPP